MQDDPCIICRQEERQNGRTPSRSCRTRAALLSDKSRVKQETASAARPMKRAARSRMPAALPRGLSCSNLRRSHSEMAATLRRRDTRTPGAQHQPATQDRQRWIGERDVRLHRRREPERFASTMARRAVSRWVRIRAPDRVRLLNHSYTLCRADSAAICGGNAIAH